MIALQKKTMASELWEWLVSIEGSLNVDGVRWYSGELMNPYAFVEFNGSSVKVACVLGPERAEWTVWCGLECPIEVVQSLVLKALEGAR